MDHMLARFVEQQVDFVLVHVDLDYFKQVNDTYGHAAGDYVLQKAARCLVDETRKGDVVIRAGGDEFVLLLRGNVTAEDLLSTGQRIIERLEVPIQFGGNTCQISGSIGATFSVYYETPNVDEMLHHADLALYASKRNGRARATLYDPAVHSEDVSDEEGAGTGESGVAAE